MGNTSDHDLWLKHDASVFFSEAAPKIESAFYPLYRYGNYYSFSVYRLARLVGEVELDPAFCRAISSGFNDVCRPNPVAIKGIERLTGKVHFTGLERDKTRFLERLAAAMQEDADQVEAANPGKTNIILCGGKDSLNLLLLKWSNPVVAYSAEPNFELVRKFSVENSLGIEVRRLEDTEDPDLKQREIAEAAGQVHHGSWKWAAALRDIAEACDQNAVFWKGQLGDIYLAPNWRFYSASRSTFYKKLRSAYRMGCQKLPACAPVADALFAKHAIRSTAHGVVARGAVLQGSHMGFLRSICDSLFVSAYHGANVTRALRSMHLPSLSDHDLRPDLGRLLLGRDVKYPVANPGPSRTAFREDWRSIPNLVEALQHHDIRVTNARDVLG
ncbi:hypothetical protein [Leisingera sp. JC11]|uniref:hypothetical protein n=1 Tax=Leisingera sp. JC11 TaxID=3042469 RepID=UPI0034518938